MAEVIGVAASIVTLAGLGIKLSLGLREAVSDVKSAASHVHDIATSISLISSTLRHVGDSIKQDTSPHSKNALRTLEEISEQCRSIFRQVKDMLQSFRRANKNGHGPRVSLSNKIRFIFKKHTIEHFITRLESLKLTLSIMLQVFQLHMLESSAWDRKAAIDAHEEQIESLRGEIKSLLIDRCWARRKENQSQHQSNQSNEIIQSLSDENNPITELTHRDSGSLDDYDILDSLGDDGGSDSSSNDTSLGHGVIVESRGLRGLDRFLGDTEDSINTASISLSTMQYSEQVIGKLLLTWCKEVDLEISEVQSPDQGPIRFSQNSGLRSRDSTVPDNYQLDNHRHYEFVNHIVDGSHNEYSGKQNKLANDTNGEHHRQENEYSDANIRQQADSDEKENGTKFYTDRLWSDGPLFRSRVPDALVWEKYMYRFVIPLASVVAQCPALKWNTDDDDLKRTLREGNCFVACAEHLYATQDDAKGIQFKTHFFKSFFTRKALNSKLRLNRKERLGLHAFRSSLHHQSTVFEDMAGLQVKTLLYTTWTLTDYENILKAYQESKIERSHDEESPWELNIEQQYHLFQHLRRYEAARAAGAIPRRYHKPGPPNNDHLISLRGPVLSAEL